MLTLRMLWNEYDKRLLPNSESLSLYFQPLFFPRENIAFSSTMRIFAGFISGNIYPHAKYAILRLLDILFSIQGILYRISMNTNVLSFKRHDRFFPFDFANVHNCRALDEVEHFQCFKMGSFRCSAEFSTFLFQFTTIVIDLN